MMQRIHIDVPITASMRLIETIDAPPGDQLTQCCQTPSESAPSLLSLSTPDISEDSFC